jgi:glutathione S-transferase
MTLTLYCHPFAAYCQKVLIALYENETPFTPVQVDLGDPDQRARLAALWPPTLFPVLVDDARGVTLPESTIIIEYVATCYPGPFAAIPAEPAAALEARLWDRVFDGFVMLPMQTIVFDRIRPGDAKDPHGVAQARAKLDMAYRMIDERLATRTWAVGEDFSVADCAAAPALFYAEWVHPFSEKHPALAAYYARLEARPSFARVIEEARPHRSLFPQEQTA